MNVFYESLRARYLRDNEIFIAMNIPFCDYLEAATLLGNPMQFIYVAVLSLRRMTIVIKRIKLTLYCHLMIVGLFIANEGSELEVNEVAVLS